MHYTLTLRVIKLFHKHAFEKHKSAKAAGIRDHDCDEMTAYSMCNSRWQKTMLFERQYVFLNKLNANTYYTQLGLSLSN